MKTTKFVQIPLDINDLRDYKELHSLLKVCNQFISNSEAYIKKLIYDEYVKTYDEWCKILSPSDIERISEFRNPKEINFRYHRRIEECGGTRIYRSIGDNTFGYYGDFHFSPTTGCSNSKPIRYEFNNNGTKITIINEYGTASTRTAGWGRPQRYDWYEDIWELDLVKKTFKLIKKS